MQRPPHREGFDLPGHAFPRHALPGPALADPVLTGLVCPALTVTFGLQLMRLMIPTVISVERDRLGAPLRLLALFAFGTFLLGFLGPPLERALGTRRMLAASAGGAALVRLVLQLVPDALVRWLVAPLGVVLFLWAVPAFLNAARGTAAARRLGLALLLGLALDTALHGVTGTWDYAWTTSPAAVALAAALAAAQLVALRRFLAATCLVRPAKAAPWALLPLAGVGPAMFLEALVLQSVGWQAVLGRSTQARAFLLVMVGNAVALAAGAAATWVPRPGWPATAVLLAALAATAGLLRQAPTGTLLLGQATVAWLVVMVVRCAAGPGARPAGRTGAAWALGMLLFVVLVFVYYAGFNRALPFDNGVLLPVAAALLGLAGTGAQLALRPAGRPTPDPDPEREPDPERRWALPGVAAAGLALLVAPAAFWMAAPDPVLAADRGFPVRVMSYNLHFGDGVAGWCDLEATARTIQASGAEVIGLNEVSRGWYLHGSVDMLAWLQRRLRMPYAVFGPTSDAMWGNAILSRHPIVASEVAPLPRGPAPLQRERVWDHVDHRGYISARIGLGGGEAVRVILTHLQHMERPEDSQVRMAQVPVLVAAWSGQPRTILLGDFNAHPDWPEIAVLRRAGLQDAWVAAHGTAADELTHASDHPFERLDYIWLSPDLHASGFQATSGTASDHRGISVTLSS